MNKEEAIKWAIDTKAISAFTRNFIEWLYNNGGEIIPPSMTWTKIVRMHENIRMKQKQRLETLEQKMGK